ncbi:unnamed protein product [Vitrella brassicaformis CCMP3155]|uniref:Mitogen-activated protein kinase n=1 Tax=Vitrella brassicaformis (strain CCMP3155) TaxID=1169540 RepID=A0A0G4EIV1_VITBC|nr:unnamed protein product [Vitrella brassicaformis CCMP3155]|eukprot:CEL95834.1 unnamed protein product [Vitrella brassicaformis CCMP3155]
MLRYPRASEDFRVLDTSGGTSGLHKASDSTIAMSPEQCVGHRDVQMESGESDSPMPDYCKETSNTSLGSLLLESRSTQESLNRGRSVVEGLDVIMCQAEGAFPPPPSPYNALATASHRHGTSTVVRRRVRAVPMLPVPTTETYEIGKETFEVDIKYGDVELIGQGAYGTVASARHRQSGSMVAIKKVTHLFDHSVFAKRTIRELKVLRHLSHENIISLVEIQLPEDKESFEEIYFVTELMQADLGTIIQSRQDLTNEHFQFFVYQILRGLKYVHSCGVIHRDLKPRNLLVNGNCDLKICDFGLARLKGERESFRLSPMTEYVTTRWYRAPEILCSFRYYDEKVDVWSAGCVLAELILRAPIFPGTSTRRQLELICGLIGKPTDGEIDAVNNRRCRDFLSGLPDRQPPLCEIFDGTPVSAHGVDLIGRMLTFDPNKRISVTEALEHPYLANLHCPQDEPGGRLIPLDEFLFEDHEDHEACIRELIYREALHYHPRARSIYERYYKRDDVIYMMMADNKDDDDDDDTNNEGEGEGEGEDEQRADACCR